MTSTSHLAMLRSAFADAAAVLGAIPTDANTWDSLDDDAIVELHRLASEQQVMTSSLVAVTAGQISHRSRPALGSRGLARRGGFRTPHEMVRITGGSTGVEATRAVRAGRIIRQTQVAGFPDPVTGEIQVPEEPWLAVVGRMMTAGLSTAAGDAIRSGLGEPSATVTAEALAAAAEQLCAEARLLDPDSLYRRARQLRDELDAAGIGDREEERRQKRSITLTRLPDGMGRLIWTMDPETLHVVGSVFDRLTSPRRGGPRFGPTEVQEHADRILDDPRTTPQIASDGFTQLLQNGVATDPGLVLGTGVPAVRILTIHRSPAADLVRDAHDHPCQVGRSHRHESSARSPGDAPAGDEQGVPGWPEGTPGWFEGQPDALSPETVARMICTGTTHEITFTSDGVPLDIGRELRLFTSRQRVVMGARDGGCRWPGCDRPPSWAEAHHVEQWSRDHGKTDIANGLLLCRHHHMLLHNNHWEIRRDGGDYWLIPPADIDSRRTPRSMPSTSTAYTTLIGAE